MTAKDPDTDRSKGGPGSSHQSAKKPGPNEDPRPEPGQPTNPDHSRVSGGGGERDRHHTHDPRRK
jgi:hypothetical protein